MSPRELDAERRGLLSSWSEISKAARWLVTALVALTVTGGVLVILGTSRSSSPDDGWDRAASHGWDLVLVLVAGTIATCLVQHWS